MDPVRGLIHLGLKMTETTLDRALDVIRLADTLLVATAVPPLRERDADASAWPDEEQADLDALSATLRARRTEPDTTSEVPVSTSPRPTSGKKAAPRRSSTKKATPAKKAPAKKAPAKPAPAKKSTAKKAPAKKAPAKKAPAKTLRVLPDA